jgi:hypothetical protein
VPFRVFRRVCARATRALLDHRWALADRTDTARPMWANATRRSWLVILPLAAATSRPRICLCWGRRRHGGDLSSFKTAAHLVAFGGFPRWGRRRRDSFLNIKWTFSEDLHHILELFDVDPVIDWLNETGVLYGVSLRDLSDRQAVSHESSRTISSPRLREEHIPDTASMSSIFRKRSLRDETPDAMAGSREQAAPILGINLMFELLAYVATTAPKRPALLRCTARLSEHETPVDVSTQIIHQHGIRSRAPIDRGGVRTLRDPFFSISSSASFVGCPCGTMTF